MKAHTIKLRVGDTVTVRTGSDKGKTGKVTAVHPKLNKVTVDGINVVTKHRKPNARLPQGGIEKVTVPIDVSKVGISHPKDAKKTSRIGYESGKDGSKKRVYRQADNKEIK